MNRLYKLIILIVEIPLGCILLFTNIKIPCLFSVIFHISCPACGITRAFKSLFKLQIIDAFKYNYFNFIILIFLLLFNLYLIYDIVTNKKKLNEYFDYLGNHYILIILGLIINTILNNIK